MARIFINEQKKHVHTTPSGKKVYDLLEVYQCERTLEIFYRYSWHYNNIVSKARLYKANELPRSVVDIFKK